MLSFFLLRVGENHTLPDDCTTFDVTLLIKAKKIYVYYVMVMSGSLSEDNGREL